MFRLSNIFFLKNSFWYATLHNIIFAMNGQCSIRRPHLSNYTHQTTYGLTPREIWTLNSKNYRISANRIFGLLLAIICNLLRSTMRDGISYRPSDHSYSEFMVTQKIMKSIYPRYQQNWPEDAAGGGHPPANFAGI